MQVKKVLIPVLAGALVLSVPVGGSGAESGQGWRWSLPAAGAAAAKEVTFKLVKKGETIVTAGVRQIDYAWVASDASVTTEMLHVLELDLNNPYVQLNAMGGKGGSVTSGQSVGAMARETRAVAGINADVFGTANEGAPIGTEIRGGQLTVSSSRLKGMYGFAITKDRKPLIDLFSFQGTVTAADGTTFALEGVNKSSYRTEPDNGYSHVDKLYMYTNLWTAPERPAGSGTTPTEALVVNGVVTEVSAGQPITTPIPANGYILRGHRSAADFITGHLKVGDPVQTAYSLQSATTGRTYDPAEFQMMVGGHTILLDGGKAAPFSRDIGGVSGSADRARTAVGYSKDGTKVYLVTVEENGGRKGMTLKELQQALLALGVWKAVNLDGGGSTTMVSRPLGEFDVSLTHPTSYGTTQRQVANGIGVYTTAPAGSLKGIVASGPETLFVGQTATYALKAYDTYYNPVHPGDVTPEWSLSQPIGTFQDGRLLVTKPGKAELTVKSGAAKDSLAVEVIAESQVQQLVVEPNTTVLRDGAVISVPAKVRLTDGRELNVPAAALTWQFYGFTGTAEGGKLTIGQVNPNAQVGYAVARYEGFSTVVVLAPGTEKTFEDFENVSYGVKFEAGPNDKDTVGTAAVISGVQGRETSKVLTLGYDFTVGSGDRFAYAVLNGNGLSIEGKPSALTIDVLGDGSNNWLRAEFIDAKGAIVRVDLAKAINWSGWKTLKADLGAAGLTYPAKLKRLYLVNLAEDQDERALQGEVAFDNLKLQYPPDEIDRAKTDVELIVGQATARVNGETVKLDAAPFMQNGVNYVPLRFIADAFGGQAMWDGDRKRVTVLRGDTMLELWVGKADMIRNGVRQTATSAPLLKNGRVLVPVRIVSEQLGQTVDWAGKEKKITIR